MDPRDVLETTLARRDLARCDARAVLNAVLDGDVDSHWLAGWLIALRAKGESVDELAGMAEAMRDHVDPVRSDYDALVDTCGTGGDGADTFNVSTASAFVAAGAGARVAKHGNRAVSSRSGSADVLEALGGAIDLDTDGVAASIDEIGFGFQFAPRHHAAMLHAVPARRGLGVRTAFNLLGPLTNPAGAAHQLVGVFAPERLHTVAEVLSALGTRRSLVVHGRDGLDELTVCAVNDAVLVEDGQLQSMEIDPTAYGLGLHTAEGLRGGNATRNAEIVSAVLGGEKGPARDIVVLNAGAALWTAAIATSLEEGVERAAEAIDDGRARDLLHRWVAFTRARADGGSR
ncbi:MAG TPA: anthranilate phosphoribosyltransferase [Candidatus Krumholzibacteria bacterium]|nr:anthranilate phosphoribosyltransferase [Candidatus Krumholzibacteria bacterium]